MSGTFWHGRLRASPIARPIVARRRSIGCVGIVAALMAVTAACAPSTQALRAATCAHTLVSDVTGTVSDPSLNEVSGVVSSSKNAGVLWVHNDSGDSPRVFALNTAGAVLGTFDITGATAQDWEDIAIGPGPVTGTRYLYLGDIGDNSSTRTSIAVFRVPEPVVDSTAPPVGTQAAPGVEKLTLRYPDVPHNAETLLVDTNGDIYVVTKQFGSSTVFEAPAGLAAGSTTTMTQVATVSLNAGALLTGGDISPAGDAIVLRTYGEVYLYERPNGATVASAFSGTRCSGALASEPQGEAIAFTADARGYLTMSEGVGRPVNRYRVP